MSAAPRILVVEDSDTQALQIRRMLEAQGFAVDRAATAEAALESLNGRLPDLVIADYRLPGMHGDELSRQMRLKLRTRAIPVLMLTEAREQGLERQGLESGADAYLPKSADPALMFLRIRALLRRGGVGAPDPAAGPGAAPGRPAFTVFRRPRILVVDGTAAGGQCLSALLGAEGHDVGLASSAAEALAKAASPGASWDCLLVSLEGQDFDGVELCRRLNALRGLGSTESETSLFEIAALGGADPPERALLIRAYEAGADDLLPRSASAEALGVRIRAMLRRKLLRDENLRIEAELLERQLAAEHARADAAAAEAKAALAVELARANAELEDANRRLVEAQARLVQAAKMASLGELVAGIAHEINNPLAFILAHQGTVEKLVERAEAALEPGQDSVRSLLGRARERTRSMGIGLHRIQDLVVRLRSFSRLDEGGHQAVHMPEGIETVLALLAQKIGSRIRVVRRLEAEPSLLCSPALLNQVVMNIVGNAADAIPGEGTIEIATRNDADSYTIEIADSGPGIPPEQRERIFEPFFTTKPAGTSTGLGLAIAYAVVRAHNGNITVGESQAGGAKITVSVPLRRGQ